MLYYYLKIIHILSAALFLTGIVYSFSLWRKGSEAFIRIQTLAWTVIIPLALFQLMSGFTIISLQHYNVAMTWVKGSIIGFLLLIACWISFVYSLFTSRSRLLQKTLLGACTIILLAMVFFMANKI